MKKIKILISIILIFSMLPLGVFADEQLSSYDTNNISVVETNDGIKVYYRHKSSGYLYVYDESTGLNKMLNTNNVYFVSAINTENGVKVYYRNNSDNGSLYVYDELSETNTKLNTTKTSYINAIKTTNGVSVYYSNDSEGYSLYRYENNTNTHTKLSSSRTSYLSAISNESGGATVYYRNGTDGFLYSYNDYSNFTKKINSISSDNISPVNTEEGTKVYYRNIDDSNALYVYNQTTGTNTKVNNTSVDYISAINTETGLKIYYANQNDNYSLYRFDEATGIEIKLNSYRSYYIEPIETLGGVKVYYSNASIVDRLYRFDDITFSTEEIINVQENHGMTFVNLYWENPENEFLEKVIVYKNNTKIAEVNAPNNQYNANNLTPNTEYTFKLTNSYTGDLETDGVTIIVKTDALPEVNNISNTVEYNQISLNWLETNFTDFEGVNIYLNGQLNQTIPKGTKTALLTGLTELTTYEIKLTVLDRFGNESEGKIINVTTPEKPIAERPEVSDVNVKTTFERVDLSWQLPESDAFRHVNIYRDKETETESTASILDLFETKVSAAENKIFETNGTYFNDFTVEPDTSYEYTLTTTNVDSVESDGVTVQATTEPEPMPQVVNPKGEESSSGDYLVTWDEPSTGTMQIWVNGNLYDTVPAADQTYTVPSESVVVDMFGVPDVQLKAATENGTVGNITKVQPGANFSHVKLPFNVGQLLDTVMGLILLVGPFILLAIVIRFAPQIVRFLKDTLARYKGGKYKL